MATVVPIPPFSAADLLAKIATCDGGKVVLSNIVDSVGAGAIAPGNVALFLQEWVKQAFEEGSVIGGAKSLTSFELLRLLDSVEEWQDEDWLPIKVHLNSAATDRFSHVKRLVDLIKSFKSPLKDRSGAIMPLPIRDLTPTPSQLDALRDSVALAEPRADARLHWKKPWIWVTDVSKLQSSLTFIKNPLNYPDAVRDLLGLVHLGKSIDKVDRSNNYLVTLHMKAETLPLSQKPSFAHSGINFRFCPWPATKSDTWGYTADLSKLVSRVSDVRGQRERVARIPPVYPHTEIAYSVLGPMRISRWANGHMWEPEHTDRFATLRLNSRDVISLIQIISAY